MHDFALDNCFTIVINLLNYLMKLNRVTISIKAESFRDIDSYTKQ